VELVHKERTLFNSGVLGREEEAEGGVGGAAGIKRDGIAAIED
jgi:hypothetical protein